MPGHNASDCHAFSGLLISWLYKACSTISLVKHPPGLEKHKNLINNFNVLLVCYFFPPYTKLENTQYSKETFYVSLISHTNWSVTAHCLVNDDLEAHKRVQLQRVVSLWMFYFRDTRTQGFHIFKV